MQTNLFLHLGGAFDGQWLATGGHLVTVLPVPDAARPESIFESHAYTRAKVHNTDTGRTFIVYVYHLTPTSNELARRAVVQLDCPPSNTCLAE